PAGRGGRGCAWWWAVGVGNREVEITISAVTPKSRAWILLRLIVIQRNIQRRGGVRQRPDADPVHAGFGDGADRVQRHTTRRLQLHRRRGGVAAAHALAHLVESHVV